MNPMKLLQLKSDWDQFVRSHPKFVPFIKAVGADGFRPGTVLEVTVTTPEGQKYTTNLKVTESDMKFVENIKDSLGQK
ncbi:MAG: hypothetical protein ACI4AQ_04985 [Lachnospiraceae bacterium]